jgi:hypothetical protein
MYPVELLLIDLYQVMEVEHHLMFPNDHEFVRVLMFSVLHVVKFLFPIDFAFDEVQYYLVVVLV